MLTKDYETTMELRKKIETNAKSRIKEIKGLNKACDSDFIDIDHFTRFPGDLDMETVLDVIAKIPDHPKYSHFQSKIPVLESFLEERDTHSYRLMQNSYKKSDYDDLLNHLDEELHVIRSELGCLSTKNRAIESFQLRKFYREKDHPITPISVGSLMYELEEQQNQDPCDLEKLQNIENIPFHKEMFSIIQKNSEIAQMISNMNIDCSNESDFLISIEEYLHFAENPENESLAFAANPISSKLLAPDLSEKIGKFQSYYFGLPQTFESIREVEQHYFGKE